MTWRQLSFLKTGEVAVFVFFCLQKILPVSSTSVVSFYFPSLFFLFFIIIIISFGYFVFLTTAFQPHKRLHVSTVQKVRHGGLGYCSL